MFAGVEPRTDDDEGLAWIAFRFTKERLGRAYKLGHISWIQALMEILEAFVRLEVHVRNEL